MVIAPRRSHALAVTLLVAAASLPAAPAADSVPLKALPAVDAAGVLTHVKALASDAFEGRAPGTPGEEKTVAYLIDQFKALGLKPGNPDGTFVQKVPLVGITPAAAPLTISGGAGAPMALAWRDDVVAWTKRVTDEVKVEASDLVFVGYGVEAPEYQWDDYKGVDVAGKTLVMLVNDPPVPDPKTPSALDPKTFGGRAMTYYGRWTYKYEIGARKKAAAVLIVHETGPAGYPFAVVQGKTGEQFGSVAPDKNMGRAAIEGWITLDQAKRLMAPCRPGLRSPQGPGGDPRLQAGPARPHGIDDHPQHHAPGRFAQRRGPARGQRRQPARTSTWSTRRTGITSASASRSTATRSTTAPSTTRPARRRSWRWHARSPSCRRRPSARSSSCR